MVRRFTEFPDPSVRQISSVLSLFALNTPVVYKRPRTRTSILTLSVGFASLEQGKFNEVFAKLFILVPTLKRLFPDNENPNQIDRNIWNHQDSAPLHVSVKVQMDW